jgi:hypothetical protein
MNQAENKENPNDLEQQPEAISSIYLHRLLEISTTLSSTLDIKQLLDMVIDTTTELTKPPVQGFLDDRCPWRAALPAGLLAMPSH